MKKFTRLVPAAAVLAATLATPTAAAADVCVRAGYSLLGNGTLVSHCHNTGWTTLSRDTSAGEPQLVEVRVGITVPLPLPSRDAQPEPDAEGIIASVVLLNRVI